MFETELQMQKEFIKLLNSKKTNHQNILEEFNARFGNVDVVMADLSNLQINITESQANLLSNYSTALVVAFLHRKRAHTLKYLTEKTGYTENYLSSIISMLKKENIIEETNNKFTICKNFEFPHLNFTAYELKLKQWKKAILQAIKNKNFASQSYVVMPDEIACKLNKNNSEIFLEYGIGLIGIKNNNLKYYITPSNNIHNFSISPIFISSIAKYLLLSKSQFCYYSSVGRAQHR